MEVNVGLTVGEIWKIKAVTKTIEITSQSTS